MLYKITFLSFSLLTLSTLAMNSTIPLAEAPKKETVSVTEPCAKAIEQINHDGPVLYYYLKGSFATIAEMNRADITPSLLLGHFTKGKISIDDETKLQYMPATDYLKTIISKDFEKFDDFFKKIHAETKDLTATWKAFRKHFKQEGIAKPFVALKEQLVKHDQEEQELAKKGIFFRGNTVIINPDLAEEGAYPEAENQCKQQ